MINVSKIRNQKAFSSFQIRNIKRNGKASDLYKVVQGKRKIGEFNFSDDGHISSLVIKRKYRRTKTSTFALLTIFDFVKKVAQQKEMDCLYFFGLKNNSNNVIRLYSKIASAIYGDIGDNRTLFTIRTPHYLEMQKEAEKAISGFIKITKDNIDNILSVKNV